MTCPAFQNHGLLKGLNMESLEQHYKDALQKAQFPPGWAVQAQSTLGGLYNSSSGSVSSSSSSLQSSWSTQGSADYTINTSLYEVIKDHVQQTKMKVIKFFRLNKECQAIEGSEVPDPIDRLRIKAAKWLSGV